MKVILIRHAETEWNKQGLIQGQSNSELTLLGRAQTSALLTDLAQNNFPIECVYASPLGRTWQLGQRLAAQYACSLKAEVALKEQAFGQFEGMSITTLLHAFPNEANALFTQDANYCPPGGESLIKACQRMIAFLSRVQKTGHDKTVSIVTHGHISQGVLALLKEGTIDHFSRYAQPNASYSVFDLKNGKCEGLKWGIATHLRHCK